MAQRSEDFFNDFGSSGKQNVGGAGGAAGGPRNRRAPPPPPRPAGAPSSGSVPSYSAAAASSSAGTRPRPAAASGTSLRKSGSGSGMVKGVGSGSNLAGGSRPAAPSYYGGSSAGAPPAPNPYASTSAGAGSTTMPSGGAQRPQQQQPYYGQQSQQPAAASKPSSSDWYSTPSNDMNMSQWAAAPAADNNNFNSSASQMQPLLSGAVAPAPNAWGGTPAPGLAGTMDSNNNIGQPMQQQPMQPSIFQPHVAKPSDSSSMGQSFDDFENEPPLLEELGINIEHIFMKTKAVVIPFRRFHTKHSALMEPSMIVEEADLAGPLAFALLLGGELLLAGKISFGYIYGFGMFGCLAMTLVLNLMSPQQAVSVWTVTSILGYSLLPVNVLAAVKILLVNIAKLTLIGRILGFLTVVWSTLASTRLLEVGCNMTDQRYLVAYPIALLYSAFVLITIF